MTGPGRLKCMRFYRWWSRGWLPILIAFLPALLCLWGLALGAQQDRANREQERLIRGHVKTPITRSWR